MTKLTPGRVEIVVLMLGRGWPRASAALTAGVSRRTLYRRLRDTPAIRAAVEAAERRYASGQAERLLSEREHWRTACDFRLDRRPWGTPGG